VDGLRACLDVAVIDQEPGSIFMSRRAASSDGS
jgi:hypothetical protein